MGLLEYNMVNFFIAEYGNNMVSLNCFSILYQNNISHKHVWQIGRSGTLPNGSSP